MRRLAFLLFCLLGLAPLAMATNFTVRQGGGGNFTTIQACANAMANGDSCTVFAATYNENVTVPAGGVGAYKTIQANGSDIVSVQGFTLNSHTKLIGNCATKQGTVTTANCGFFISNTPSPSTGCVNLPNNTTDVFIQNNVMYACGGIGPGWPTRTSFIYIQGNTISYTNSTIATVPTVCLGAGSPVGNSSNLYGDHFLVENNDLSHFTISMNWNSQFSVVRNNNFHDTVEAQNAGNCHSDTWFSEPGISLPNDNNVYEGNYQYNGQGGNAKGVLAQAETCGGTCNIIVIRFNVTNRIGSGSTTDDRSWPNVKVYNNTLADPNYDAGNGAGNTLVSDNSSDSNPPNPSYLNQIYYYSLPIVAVNPYDCGSTCNFGHNLAFCSSGCTNIYSHVYSSGSFLSDPGNKNADPQFVNYIAAANPSNDFHLKAGSPAIAAGTFLTTASNSGSGSTSLTVGDVTYFQDGYGLTGVQPDCIAIGTVSNTACIVAGSINYTNNTLTLQTALTWSNGASVWLFKKSDGVTVLTGSAPDMGAFPFIAGGACTPFQLGFNLQPSNAELGASISLTINILDSGGNPCNTSTNAVTLSKDAAATWGTLNSSSSLTKNASGGLASWNDLFVTGSTGTGSIDAAATGLTGVASNSITISCTPTKIIITGQPSSAQTGASLGTFALNIQNVASQVCPGATNAVTLQKHTGATWGILNSSSSLTKNASGGLASWNDLFVTGSTGTGSIDATSSGLTIGTSNSITISCTASQLAFIVQPASTIIGASLGSVQVGITNSNGGVCVASTNPITLSKDASATWCQLKASNNDLTQIPVSGSSVWADLSIVQCIGSGAIDAAASGLTGAISNSITIGPVTGRGNRLRRGGH